MFYMNLCEIKGDRENRAENMSDLKEHKIAEREGLEVALLMWLDSAAFSLMIIGLLLYGYAG